MITTYIELSCDHDGCTTAYAPSVTEVTSVQATRVGSVIAGWTRRDGLDYCPEHAAEAEPPTVARVRELAAKGLGDAQIGAQLGMERGGVQKLRKRYGIPGRRPGRPGSSPARRDGVDQDGGKP